MARNTGLFNAKKSARLCENLNQLTGQNLTLHPLYNTDSQVIDIPLNPVGTLHHVRFLKAANLTPLR
jgi:hypothetical protein